jgi:hypothetical protein
MGPTKANSEPVQSKRHKPAPAGGSHTSPTRASRSTVPLAAALLEIEIDHKFADAQMSIWVDDKLTYTHPLEGIEKKRLVVFRHIQGHEFHAVQIPPGKHLLRVQVTSGTGLSAQTATIDGEFASGTENLLRILFNNNGEMNLSLR